MTDQLHQSVMNAMKVVVKFAKIISISADEVTAIDHMSWIGVHVYAIENWERIPYLLHLSHVTEGGKSDHLTSVIMNSLMCKGSLSRVDLARKLMSFHSDNVNTFQESKTRIL